MSKQTPFSVKSAKVDFSLLETYYSADGKIYVFLVKNRLNVRSFIVWDLISKTYVRYLVRDISRAARRDLEKFYRIVPFYEGARALSSLLKFVAGENESKD